jgi:predicted nucleic acid-binding protein
VVRALLPLGASAVQQGEEVLAGVELVRVNDRLLRAAGALEPAELRTLDAIHLATAVHLGVDLARLVTYDARMATAAETMGLSVVTPR